MGTNDQWAALTMSRAHISPTNNTVDIFKRWMAVENPRNDWWHFFNPLNCGLLDGSASGEGSYSSLDLAATRTATVMLQSNMRVLWLPLSQNASLAAFSAGAAASPWSTGYHGKPGYIASISAVSTIECGFGFPLVGQPVDLTPAPVEIPVPIVITPNAPPPEEGDMIASNEPDTERLKGQIKEWWVDHRTDVCTSEAINILVYAFRLSVVQGGFGGSPFNLFSNIIDGTAAHPAPLRPQFAGAV